MHDDSYLLVPAKWLEAISSDQKKILSLLESENDFSVNHLGDYIPESEAKILLGRRTTWFWKMRTSGQLPYSKVGSKVYYDKSILLKLIANNAK